MELNASRQVGFVACPITWFEIDALSRGAGLYIRPWERELIREIDMAVMTLWRAKENKTGQKKPVVQQRKLSEGLFDALF
ncbi:hypothetical protein ABE440_04300 [Brucella anthropi]